MALKDALKTPPIVRTGYRSKIDTWREALEQSERNAFDRAVKNPAWPSSAIVEAVEAEGLTISEGAFRDWRKRFLRENP